MSACLDDACVLGDIRMLCAGVPRNICHSLSVNVSSYGLGTHHCASRVGGLTPMFAWDPATRDPTPASPGGFRAVHCAAVRVMRRRRIVVRVQPWFSGTQTAKSSSSACRSTF